MIFFKVLRLNKLLYLKRVSFLCQSHDELVVVILGLFEPADDAITLFGTIIAVTTNVPIVASFLE